MDQLIEKLSAGQSSSEVEEAIVDISGQEAEVLQENRNVITTALNGLIDENAKLSFDMNAKLRRRVKRLLTALEGTGGAATGNGNGTNGAGASGGQVSEFSDNYDKQLDSQLEAFASSLTGVSDCEEIEKILQSVPMNDIQHNSPGLKSLHSQLEAISNNSNLEMNAKLRRRVKRSIESISKLTVVVHVPDVQSHQSSYYPTYVPPPMPDPVSTDETIRLLKSVQTLSDVEYAMNSYVSILPPVGDEVEDPTVTKKKQVLRQAMVNVLLSPQRESITNKKLRHRMEKAAYLLDPTAPPIKKPTKPPTKAEKKAASASAVAAASTSTKGSSGVTTAPEVASAPTPVTSVFTPETPINLATVTIDNIMSTLDSATTANELLVAVENIPARKEDLLICFRSSDDAKQDGNSGDFDIVGATKLLEIFEKILEEDGYVNGSMDAVGEDGESPAGPVKIKLIAKTKRKMKRITAALQAALVDATPAPVVEEEPEVTEEEDVKETVPAEELPPLEPIIASIKEATDSNEIESLLNGVKPGAGSCKSRRTLKRTLDRILDSEDNTEGDVKRVKLTSNSRRKIKRVLKIIEPNANDGKNDTPVVVKKEVDNKRKAVGEAGEVDEHGVERKPKYRLFIGQMDFDTTSEDLETYLRDQGLDCPINIRILTDRETGKSRGAAFLDICGGKRSLKRCLSLHHTQLKGRRINVEKTSKGLKDEMAVKQRRIDLKIQESEKVDKILSEYEGNSEKNVGGVFTVKNISDSMMNRLYAMNTNEIQDILNDFSVACKDRSVDGGAVFQKLVTAKDGGGSAVDQSKGKGYGAFKSKFPSDRVPSNNVGRGGNINSNRDNNDSMISSGPSDDVPWGYSGVAQPQENSSGIAEVFQSMRGRGGKRVGSVR